MMKVFALVVCSVGLASAMFPYRRMMNPMMNPMAGGMNPMGGGMGGMRRYDMDYRVDPMNRRDFRTVDRMGRRDFGTMDRMDRRDFRGMDGGLGYNQGMGGTGGGFGFNQGIGGMGMSGMGGMGGIGGNAMYAPESAFDRPSYEPREQVLVINQGGRRRMY